MKYSIVFSSVTGNTRQLADAILSVLPQENLRYFGPPAEIALEADRLYVGFWTDKGHCNKEISTFLKGVKKFSCLVPPGSVVAKNISIKFLTLFRSTSTVAIL